jgi:hypothetical protein
LTSVPTHASNVASLLAAALSRIDPALLPVDVHDVQSNNELTTSHSKIVTARLGDGSARTIFCKFSPEHDYPSPTFRWGIAYEAMAYERVLRRCGETVPAYYGSASDPTGSGTWLFTEHLTDAVRIAKSPDPLAVCAAATWLGRFHREFAPRAAGPVLQSLHSHDAGYYDAWLRHAQGFVDAVEHAARWSAAVVTRRREINEHLLGAERTLVHGDFFSKNVLGTSRGVIAVDWESAATGAGEVDLASLVLGWSDEVAGACTDAYCAARWDGRPPVSFVGAFAAAQVYVLTRTAGFDKWGEATRGRARALGQLFVALQQLGVV